MTNRRNILIISMLNDIHGYAVAEGLRMKDADATLLVSSDFPSKQRYSIRIHNGKEELTAEGAGVEFSAPAFGVVWNRRPTLVVPRDVLHPADYRYAELVSNSFQESFFKILGRDSFWVNPPRSGGTKILQQHFARACGLMTPDTLYTNDPARIREFIQEHDGGIIHKPLRGQIWRKENTNKVWMPYASIVTLKDLPDDDILELSPGIYQQLTEKDFEVRITIFGKQIFAAKIDSQSTKAGKTDWRLAYDELKFEPFRVPEDIANKCFALMRDLGIVFGAMDFIVTPAGNWIFLEVNQGGQFLFLEEDTGLPMLDAFCDFLISADPEFIYQPSCGPRVDYLQVRDTMAKKIQSESNMHVPIPDDASLE